MAGNIHQRLLQHPRYAALSPDDQAAFLREPDLVESLLTKVSPEFGAIRQQDPDLAKSVLDELYQSESPLTALPKSVGQGLADTAGGVGGVTRFFEEATGLDAGVGRTVQGAAKKVSDYLQPEAVPGSWAEWFNEAARVGGAQIVPQLTGMGAAKFLGEGLDAAQKLARARNVSLGVMGTQATGQKYSEVRDRQARGELPGGVGRAGAAALLSGATEVATEFLPTEALLDPGKSFAKRLAGSIFSDIPGEEFSNVGGEFIARNVEGIPESEYKPYAEQLLDPKTAFISALSSGGMSVAHEVINQALPAAKESDDPVVVVTADAMEKAYTNLMETGAPDAIDQFRNYLNTIIESPDFAGESKAQAKVLAAKLKISLDQAQEQEQQTTPGIGMEDAAVLLEVVKSATTGDPMAMISSIIGREIETPNQLTPVEFDQVFEQIGTVAQQAGVPLEELVTEAAANAAPPVEETPAPALTPEQEAEAYAAMDLVERGRPALAGMQTRLETAGARVKEQKTDQLSRGQTIFDYIESTPDEASRASAMQDFVALPRPMQNQIVREARGITATQAQKVIKKMYDAAKAGKGAAKFSPRAKKPYVFQPSARHTRAEAAVVNQISKLDRVTKAQIKSAIDRYYNISDEDVQAWWDGANLSPEKTLRVKAAIGTQADLEVAMKDGSAEDALAVLEKSKKLFSGELDLNYEAEVVPAGQTGWVDRNAEYEQQIEDARPKEVWELSDGLAYREQAPTQRAAEDLLRKRLETLKQENPEPFVAQGKSDGTAEIIDRRTGTRVGTYDDMELAGMIAESKNQVFVRTLGSNLSVRRVQEPEAKFSPKKGTTNVVSTEVRDQAESVTRATRDLGEALAQESGNAAFRDAFTPVAGNAEIARVYRDVFGKTLVTVRHNKPRLGWTFNGLILPSKPDVLYLDENSSVDPNAVAGHELLHTLRVQAPEIYNRLLVDLAPEMQNVGEFAKRLTELRRRAGIAGDMSADTMMEELIADYVGDQMATAGFWARMANRNQSLFTRVAETLRNLIEAMLRTIGLRGFGSSRWVQNLTKAQTAVVEALGKYADSRQQTDLQNGFRMDVSGERRKQNISDRFVEPVRASADPRRLTAWVRAHQKSPVALQKAVTELVTFAGIGRPARVISENVELNPALETAETDPIRSNADYLLTGDMDTACPKQQMFIAHMGEVERILGRKLKKNERWNLVYRMLRNGVNAPCPYCYVESNRMSKEEYAAKGGVTATVKPYAAYTGQLLRTSQKVIDLLNSRVGMRILSSTDMKPEHLFDMMQMVLDASSRGMQMHGYTKTEMLPRVFGKSGMKINLSTMIRIGDGGEVIFDNNGGLPIDVAERLMAINPADIGIMVMATNTKAVEAAMADPRVGMIIPYHASNLAKQIYSTMGWEDFSDEQHEHWVGDTWKGKVLVSMSPAHAKAAAKIEAALTEYLAGESGPAYAALDEYAKYWFDLRAEGRAIRNAAGAVRRGKDPNAISKLACSYVPPVGIKKFWGGTDVQKYLRLCEKFGLHPKFERFSKHPGYIKTIVDVAAWKSPQKPVRPVFDLNAADSFMEEFIQKGGRTDLTPVNGKVVRETVKDVQTGDAAFIKQLQEYAKGQVKAPNLRLSVRAPNKPTDRQLMRVIRQVADVRVANSMKQQQLIDRQIKALALADQKRKMQNEAQRRVDRLKEQELTKLQFRKEAAKLIQANLPVAERGKLMTSMLNADTPAKFRDILGQISTLMADSRKRTAKAKVVRALKGLTTSKLMSMRPEFRDPIRALLSGDANFRPSELWDTLTLLKDADGEVQYPAGLLDMMKLKNKKNLNQLSAEELEAMAQELRSLLHLNRIKNAIVGGEKLGNALSAADAIAADMKKLGKQTLGGEEGIGPEKQTARKGFFHRLWDEVSLQFEAIAERMGRVGHNLFYRAIREGRRIGQALYFKGSDLVRDELKSLGLEHDSDKFRTWSKEVVNLPTENGSMPVTRSMKMELLAHLSDASTRAEILKGGLRNKFDKNAPVMKVTEQNLADIEASATPEEKAIVRVMKDYINQTLRHHMNRQMLILEGREVAFKDDYFPRARDRQNVIQWNVDEMTMSSYVQSNLEDMGMLKERVANNAGVLLGDIFADYDNHIQRASALIGLAVPIRNARTVMGLPAWKKAIGEYQGSQFEDRIKQQLNAITEGSQYGSDPTSDPISSWVRKLMGNVSVGYLGYNPSPALKQISGIPALLAEYDPADILSGLGSLTPKEFERIKNLQTIYSPLLRARYDNSPLALMATVFGTARDSRFVENAMSMIQTADRMVTAVAWRAAEKEIARANPKVPENSDAFYELVARKAEEAISRTQNITDVIDMSGAQLEAKTQIAYRLGLMFASQGNAMVNLLRRQWDRAATGKQSWAKSAAVSATAVLSAYAANRLVGMLMKKILGKEDKDDDKENRGLRELLNLMYETLGYAYGGNLAVPVLEGIEKLARGKPMRLPSQDNPLMASFVRLGTGAAKMTSGLLSHFRGDVMTGGKDAGKPKGPDDIKRGLKDFIEGALALKGIPVFPARLALSRATSESAPTGMEAIEQKALQFRKDRGEKVEDVETEKLRIKYAYKKAFQAGNRAEAEKLWEQYPGPKRDLVRVTDPRAKIAVRNRQAFWDSLSEEERQMILKSRSVE